MAKITACNRKCDRQASGYGSTHAYPAQTPIWHQGSSSHLYTAHRLKQVISVNTFSRLRTAYMIKTGFLIPHIDEARTAYFWSCFKDLHAQGTLGRLWLLQRSSLRSLATDLFGFIPHGMRDPREATYYISIESWVYVGYKMYAKPQPKHWPNVHQIKTLHLPLPINTPLSID